MRGRFMEGDGERWRERGRFGPVTRDLFVPLRR